MIHKNTQNTLTNCTTFLESNIPSYYASNIHTYMNSLCAVHITHFEYAQYCLYTSAPVLSGLGRPGGMYVPSSGGEMVAE